MAQVLPLQAMKPAPLKSLGSFKGQASPMGSITGSKTSQSYVSGTPGATFRMTPQGSGSRPRRWADFTPMAGEAALWPPTPSPMGSYSYTSSVGFGMPQPAMQQEVYQQMPGNQMPGMPQMMMMQVPAGQMQGQGQVMVSMPAGATFGGMIMMQSAPAPMQGSGQPPAQEFVSQSQGLHSLAGRQLFQEAMDSSLLLGDSQADGSNLLTSGSAMHGTGRCSPCAWFWKSRGCNNYTNCAYCHLCPEGELKNRKKAKVAAIRMGVLEPSATHATNRGSLKLNSLI
ncbi:unnamed protein product [Polarella glacialis]|uniref:C3H1-type domain-containing protein n=1 Tax=Polarella glacialis TaxID=89957 RepID=A0A813ENF5_POLGL|nr:unnamed protein product [Polarella glacialis]|eukprot:CAMPEP_0115119658 /NCGR_PEP_ID=MMETSP0227-20121206/45223_1 /TAXON_ID=89957 /ORGANISM="Polarella glacialis, Strain CCMP 1383" /LENGTH=283 /DNA_ID=CAMNT_0002521171 /DNA_START=56 /DNA_END=907 /DNA_ORIENTATION=-